MQSSGPQRAHNVMGVSEADSANYYEFSCGRMLTSGRRLGSESLSLSRHVMLPCQLLYISTRVRNCAQRQTSQGRQARQDTPHQSPVTCQSPVTAQDSCAQRPWYPNIVLGSRVDKVLNCFASSLWGLRAIFAEYFDRFPNNFVFQKGSKTVAERTQSTPGTFAAYFFTICFNLSRKLAPYASSCSLRVTTSSRGRKPL